jgi:hypothetical protein
MFMLVSVQIGFDGFLARKARGEKRRPFGRPAPKLEPAGAAE